MNFFRIIFSVCRETAMFPVLARLPLYRTILHLLLLAILLAGVMTGLQYPTVKAVIGQAEQTVTAQFGAIRSTGEGLVPAIDPERRRQVEIFPGLVLNYFPGAEVKPGDLPWDKYDRGVVWTPGVVVAWRKDAPVVVPLIYSVKLLERGQEIKLYPGSREGIVATIGELYDPAGPFWFDDFAQFFPWLERLVLGGSYVIYFLLVFGGVLVFNTLFTGFYALGGGLAMCGMRYRNLWQMGIYAGIPALIVAAVATGLTLPYVDFSTIYLFGFLGYFFFIISRLQRKLPGDGGNSKGEEK
ncbi:MAG: hypothetical protein PHQ27_07395 [Victivallales bacterium]|nr:hypothetical protein [Victivallales bacterium]